MSYLLFPILFPWQIDSTLGIVLILLFLVNRKVSYQLEDICQGHFLRHQLLRQEHILEVSYYQLKAHLLCLWLFIQLLGSFHCF